MEVNEVEGQIINVHLPKISQAELERYVSKIPIPSASNQVANKSSLTNGNKGINGSEGSAGSARRTK